MLEDVRTVYFPAGFAAAAGFLSLSRMSEKQAAGRDKPRGLPLK
jgi:hypothetical protein